MHSKSVHTSHLVFAVVAEYAQLHHFESLIFGGNSESLDDRVVQIVNKTTQILLTILVETLKRHFQKTDSAGVSPTKISKSLGALLTLPPIRKCSKLTWVTTVGCPNLILIRPLSP